VVDSPPSTTKHFGEHQRFVSAWLSSTPFDILFPGRSVSLCPVSYAPLYTEPSSVALLFTMIDRIPVRAKFSAPVQTGPDTHPSSSTMVTGSLSPGCNAVGSSVDHLSLSNVEVKGRVDLYLYSPPPPIALHDLFSGEVKFRM
jgi:hypothetical protein